MAEAQAINVATARKWLADGGEVAFLDLREEGKLHLSGQAIKAASFAPDGRRIVAAGTDGTVRVLDARVLRVTQLLPGHDGSVFAALGSDNSLQFGMIDFTTSAGRDYWANLASRAVSLGARVLRADTAPIAVLAACALLDATRDQA